MSRKELLPRPTDAELEILQVLWQQGPSTVRQIQEVLDQRKRHGLHHRAETDADHGRQGVAARDESQRTHIYRPRVPADKTQRQLVTDLMDRVFKGSAQKLVMQALNSENVSREELSEIRVLLDEIERETP